MTHIGVVFLLCAGLFIISLFLVRYEEQHGKRLFLSTFRFWLDRQCDVVVYRIQHFIHHSLRLSWYYSLHSSLRACMGVLVASYDFLERIFTENRRRARLLRLKYSEASRSHLRAIEEHKKTTALSPGEKKKLKSKSLRGN